MKKWVLGIIFILLFCWIDAQNVEIGANSMQFFRKNDKTGINVFETTKDNNIRFKEVSLSLGVDFAMQFQALDHSTGVIDFITGMPTDKLVPLSYGFNNATANLNIDVQIYDGIRLNITSYLSSRYAPGGMLKGGYLQIDKLNFLESGFINMMMNYITIKAGHTEINYGDQHFRRTDNGNAMYNPFVGNYIMDAFTTEVMAEIYYQYKGFIIMGAVSNGDVQASTANDNVNKKKDRMPSVYYKIGYDNDLMKDFRVRLTGSGYNSLGYSANTLFAGDRSGSRYYNVLTSNPMGDYHTGRYSPYDKENFLQDNNDEFDKMNAFVINPFMKYKNFEFFGAYEILIQSKNEARNLLNRLINQYVGEIIYRDDVYNIFFGGRYGMVIGDLGQKDGVTNIKSSISRAQFSIGKFIGKYFLLKGEYVVQKYDKFREGFFDDGRFEGFMVEAVIAF